MESLPLVSEKNTVLHPFFFQRNGVCFLIIEQADKIAENNSYKTRGTWGFQTGLYSVIPGSIWQNKSHNTDCLRAPKMASASPRFRHR